MNNQRNNPRNSQLINNIKHNGIKSLIPFISVVALTLAIIASQYVHAHESNGIEADNTQFMMSDKGGRHNQIKRMFKTLKLDSTQKSDIKAIRKTARVQNKALFESLKHYKEELNTLIKADVFDEQAVTNLHNAYQVNFAQAALAKAKTHHAILQILSEEQRVKWFALIEKRKGNKAKNKQG